MKGVLKFCCGLSVALWAIFMHSQFAHAQNVVDQIDVQGNERVETSTVLLQVSSQVGQTLDPARVETDVRNIYKTGFFKDVAVEKESRGGKSILVFRVQEKPAIHKVELVGNEHVSEESLKEKLSIGARRFLDRKKIHAGIEEAKAYYESKGYYGTEITFEETPVDSKNVDLTFKVKEGKHKYVEDLVFEGNKEVSTGDLEDVLKTGTYSWYSTWLTGSGILNRPGLENDVRELSKLYLSRGYVDAKIGEPVVEEKEDSLKVTFKISEGPVYKVRNITASGTLLDENTEKTLEGVQLKSGEVFNVETLRKDVFTISEKFTDIGYAFANVDPNTDIDRSAQVVDVDYKVDKGNKVNINRINITGNKKTHDNVVRRALKIHEQELYSSSKVKRSEQLLERLGYFEEVTVAPESSDVSDVIDMNVNVREASTGTFSAGAGISSGDGFIVSGRITENNLFGTGNSLSFDANTGDRRQNLVLSFNNPRVNDTQWVFGADLLSVSRQFDDFDRKQTGGSLSVGHPITFFGPELEDDLTFVLKYELLGVDISDVKDKASSLVKSEEGKTVSSSVTPRVVRNTIDNPLDPESGSRQVLDLELAGLGGDQEFWLAGLNNTFYYPMWDSPIGMLVFCQRLTFDYGDTFNDEVFPLFKRFFPGGINSVRGYSARKLGPRDEENNVYGGSKQLVANFEMLFPIVKAIGLKGLVFYDAGNAFDDDQDIEIAELRQAAGFGIRWKSPIAPIRIEFGWPLDKVEGNKSFVTNFSFGLPQ